MPVKNKFVLLLASRKFWAAVVGIAFMLLKTYDPDFAALTEDQVTTVIVDSIGVITIITAYILGTAIEDASAKKT